MDIYSPPKHIHIHIHSSHESSPFMYMEFIHVVGEYSHIFRQFMHITGEYIYIYVGNSFTWLVCSTGRVQLGPSLQDSLLRASFGLLTTRRVGFLLPQLGSRLIGELPITSQGSYLLGIFLSWPLLPRSTHWPYWTYSHSLFLVCCHQPRLPSICYGLILPATNHFQLSRIVGTTCLLFATL